MSEQHESASGLVRLNVNLNKETADALKSSARRRGLTVTETMRRVIALAKYIQDEQARERKVHSVCAEGCCPREIIIMR